MPAEGLEPPTNGLQNRCSTTELSRRRKMRAFNCTGPGALRAPRDRWLSWAPTPRMARVHRRPACTAASSALRLKSARGKRFSELARARSLVVPSAAWAQQPTEPKHKIAH
jgi:hypothetical protein